MLSILVERQSPSILFPGAVSEAPRVCCFWPGVILGLSGRRFTPLGAPGAFGRVGAHCIAGRPADVPRSHGRDLFESFTAGPAAVGLSTTAQRSGKRWLFGPLWVENYGCGGPFGATKWKHLELGSVLIDLGANPMLPVPIAEPLLQQHRR